MKMHRVSRATGIALAAVALGAVGAGCGASESSDGGGDGGSTQAAKAADELTIGVSNLGLAAPFPAAISRGIKAAAEEQGVRIVELDGKSDPDKQANDMQDLVAQRPDGILLLPVDSGIAQGLVDLSVEAGIPVVAVASQVGDPSERELKDVYPRLTALVTQDEVASGEKAAEIVLRELPQGGEIAILEGAAGFAESKLRQVGFDEVLERSGKPFRTVASQPGDWLPEKGEAVCQNMLAAHPNLRLVYSHSDDMAVGCTKAVRQANRDVRVVGVGGSRLGMSAVESGEMAGTVCYLPEELGRVALQTIVDDLSGRRDSEAAFVSYETPATTRANASDCHAQW